MNAAVSLAVLQLTDRGTGGIRAGVAMEMGVVDEEMVRVMAEVVFWANYGGEKRRWRPPMPTESSAMRNARMSGKVV